MPGYRVREVEHAIGSHAYRLRVLVDTQQFAGPDRGKRGYFRRLLVAQAFEMDAEHCPMDDADAPPHRGRMLHYRRGSLQ